MISWDINNGWNPFTFRYNYKLSMCIMVNNILRITISIFIIDGKVYW